jgi:hypothetical protein
MPPLLVALQSGRLPLLLFLQVIETWWAGRSLGVRLAVQVTAKVNTTLKQAPVLTRARVQLKRVQSKLLPVGGGLMVQKSRLLVCCGNVHSQSRPTTPFIHHFTQQAK